MENTMNQLFTGLFDTTSTAVISVGDFVLCILVSLVIGGAMAFVHSYQAKCSHSFVTTLALLPAIVCVVIMMVNGNVGAGVAVAGAFSLVRFRSVPGTAKEIGALFMAMGAGLITGMGYLAYGVLFTLIICAVCLIYDRTDLWRAKKRGYEKVLHIIIPENLDYNGVFDEILAKYAQKYELTSVKTASLGSLFKLNYSIVMKDNSLEREMINQLRCRNGNLEISLSRTESTICEL